MPIIRTYQCIDCQQPFEVTCMPDDGAPDCPLCSKVLHWQPGMFSIPKGKAKALDITQGIMESYGYTNFKDKVDQGETVVMPPPEPQTAQKDEIVQQVAEYAQQAKGMQLTPVQAEMAAGFWGGNSAAAQMPTMSAADLLASARVAMADANAHGANPMALLHEAGRAGKLPIKIDVVARAKM